MRDVDRIIQSIMNICPSVKVEQLKVSHPGADDDGIWFFKQPGSDFEVQIESPMGMCPFLVETSESEIRFTTTSVVDTIGTLAELLHLESLR